MKYRYKNGNTIVESSIELDSTLFVPVNEEKSAVPTSEQEKGTPKKTAVKKQATTKK